MKITARAMACQIKAIVDLTLEGADTDPRDLNIIWCALDEGRERVDRATRDRANARRALKRDGG